MKRYSAVADRPGTDAIGNDRPAIACQANEPEVLLNARGERSAGLRHRHAVEPRPLIAGAETEIRINVRRTDIHVVQRVAHHAVIMQRAVWCGAGKGVRASSLMPLRRKSP